MAFQNIGALWIKQGKKGQFLSGSLEINGQKVNIMVFKNTRKTELKYPDYQICQATGEMNRPATQKPKQVSQTQQGSWPPAGFERQEFTPPTPPTVQSIGHTPDVLNEEIPF